AYASLTWSRAAAKRPRRTARSRTRSARRKNTAAMSFITFRRLRTDFRPRDSTPITIGGEACVAPASGDAATVDELRAQRRIRASQNRSQVDGLMPRAKGR